MGYMFETYSYIHGNHNCILVVSKSCQIFLLLESGFKSQECGSDAGSYLFSFTFVFFFFLFIFFWEGVGGALVALVQTSIFQYVLNQANMSPV